MSSISLNENERYTFAKVNGVPLIMDSTDGAEDINNFRNEVHITRADDEMITLHNTAAGAGSDVMVAFSGSYDSEDGGEWTIGVDARTTVLTNDWSNAFVIGKGKNTFNAPRVIVSGSGAIWIDSTALPTSDPGEAGMLWRSGTDLKISV